MRTDAGGVTISAASSGQTDGSGGVVDFNGSEIDNYKASISTTISGNRPLATTDNGKILVCDAEITLTVPTGLPIGFNCLIVQYSSTDSHYVTITAASGVTVGNNNSHTKTSGRYAIMSLLSVAANIYISSGDGAS